MTYTAPPGARNAPYAPSGSAHALVCPYMVSGRSVAASRNTGPAPCAAAAPVARAPLPQGRALQAICQCPHVAA